MSSRIRLFGTALVAAALTALAAIAAPVPQGVPHDLPVDAGQAIRFVGLDAPAVTPSPPTTAPATTPPRTTTPPLPTTPGPGPGCRIGYAVDAWNSGLTAAITITTFNDTGVSGWSLAFTLPAGQSITGGWNATYSPTSGAVTARNVSYNGSIPPGASVTIGFLASHTGDTGKPSSFTLNGSPCSVA